ncbi:aldehyde dehydrogenase [Lachnospiraceae bacterium OttesenSCG-928-D06]|nr:aldehyde dehydrogenase [Lachnospiraceae bacterium OttesenSCG-928-D06]
MIDIEKIVQKQRDFFQTGKTLDMAFRREALRRLGRTINNHKEEICQALYDDLGKSEMEARMCEVDLSLTELKHVYKHMNLWSAKHYVKTGLANFPGVSFVAREPYGVTLIMAPWNYPFLLSIEPLIGAIAAGNCCIIKPSAYAPKVSAILAKLIGAMFPERYIAVIEGGRKENEQLLEQRFDYIFFTGSVSVGKHIMKKASRYLTPVTLELGGKSPCIIDHTANLPLAAKRIAFGKFLNCGQTCVAPDYLLIEESVKEAFLELLKKAIKKMYGMEPLKNPDYGRIVNEKHFNRLLGLIEEENVIYGGKCKKESLQIEPTIIDYVSGSDPVMQEEIFGPILPILTFHNLNQAVTFIKQREKPLALYLFTRDSNVERQVIKQLSFGGGCINDTIMHLASSSLPFGGVGNSGMGSYHGKKSFETFSHEKSILKKKGRVDVPVRYQPYHSWKKKAMELFLR